MSRLKVLISAYACEPGAGSEPGAGWTWARAAAQDHDVWLLTRSNNAPDIEAAMAAEPDLAITPVYLDLPSWASWWKRAQRGVRTYYVLWQWLAMTKARQLHESVRFDVGHHLTFAIDWLPAGIAWVKDLPVIWGPVGGSTSMPWWGYRWLSAKGFFEELSREFITRFLRRIFGDSTAKRVSLIVAQNGDVAERFNGCATPLVVEPNCAIDVGSPPKRASDVVKNAVFTGRLIGWKGPRLAIQSLARTTDWTLAIYGTGGESTRLKRLVTRKRLDDRVTFHGHQPRDVVLEGVARAQAFLFPSFHDSAPWSVAEAIALGTPVICLDRGGPATLIERTRGGIAVAGGWRADRELSAALRALAAWSTPHSDASAIRVARIPKLLGSWYAYATGGVDGDDES